MKLLAFGSNLLRNLRNKNDLQQSEEDDDYYVPMPMVLIDQDSDSDATIVQVSFGDRLGALIDTVN